MINLKQALLTLSGAMCVFALPVRAEKILVFFGTGGAHAQGIYRASFDTRTGRLEPAALAAKIGSPGFLALHPDGDKLYAAANGEGGQGVTGFRIGGDGVLNAFTAAPTGDGQACHLAVHPSRRLLLTAQYGTGSVALFPLDTEGRLGAATTHKHPGPGTGVVAQRQKTPHPHWCGFSPDGRFALVPDLGLDGIMVYQIDATAPNIARHGFIAAPRGAGPRHMRFSTDGRRIHLLNELSLTVSTYAWDAETGSARLLTTVPTLSETEKAGEAHNSAAEILTHPNGRFLYASNRGNDTVTVFRADPATTAPERIQVQPVRGAFPRNINLSPCGNWLLAAGADSHTIAVHKVDPETGRLTYQTRSVISVPAPICILFARVP
ncbi:MAG TPA: lactonase family protein [Kiritimatiellia bacterium]|nr:lactonase family protein [Kiritimatiellia bacterium]HOR96861.1 lactonase family protein [Kiritimatiellia bacterium]HPC49510.1 lactonase family protein [Kiritimatiellia bacterium]HPK36997.1 lactonase family protein [Kiritimatiellia bacterium]HRU19075.1 lactonase family protein [Kiritimatiellia bacterium]